MTVVIVAEKACIRCKQPKPISDFVKKSNRKSGVDSYCKPCGVARTQDWRKSEQGREVYRASNKRPRPYSKRRSLHARCREKGISVEEYQALMVAQEGRCAICGSAAEANKGLAIDHNHDTGKVRGLLCTACNLGLGCFRDKPEFLDNARHYLLTK